MILNLRFIKKYSIFVIGILYLIGLPLLSVQAEQITVGTIIRPPFVIDNGKGGLSGFSIELLEEIASRADLEYEFKKFEVFSDMIDSAENGEVDMSIANITITSEREGRLDYSQPIYDSGLQILVAKKNSTVTFMKVIWESGILWFIVGALAILLVIAHVLWFFEKNVEDRRHDYFRDDYLGGLWDAFWWAFIIMTMGGFENEVPHKKISRVLAVFWIISSLFFISTLTAKITTSLTVSELSSGIETVQDLVDKKVGVMEGPTVREYLNLFEVDVKEYKSSKELYTALKAGEIDAVVGDAPIVQYYANNTGNKSVLLAGAVFKPEKYGIIFQEDSHIKELVDKALIEIREDGTYQELHQKYFGE